MKKIIPEIICAVGGAVLVAGLLIFAYALNMPNPAEFIFGVKRFRAEVGTVGGVAATVGVALVTFGILLLRARR